MGTIARNVELIDGANTFGIEIEFCSHDNPMMGFTHIEVCQIEKWKIETDADNTLELVSPILIFDSHEAAAAFQAELMQFLQSLLPDDFHGTARMPMTLEMVTKRIKEFLEKSAFKYPEGDKAADMAINGPEKAAFIHEINEFNWDDTASTFAALTGKELLEQSDFEFPEYAGTVLVRKSQKGGGMPSSQLNLPMRLSDYVQYCIDVKEVRSLRRVVAISGLNDESQVEPYVAGWLEKRVALLEQFKVGDRARCERLAKQALEEDKEDLWTQNAFWLLLIRRLAAHLASEKNGEWPRSVKAKTKDIKEVNRKTFPAVKNALDACLEEAKKAGKPYTPKFDICYMIAHKIITGACGSLSEEPQLEVQQKIMAEATATLATARESEAKDRKTAEDLNRILRISELGMSEIVEDATRGTDEELLAMHSGLKDLTPLWFKGALADVMIEFQKKVKPETLIDPLEQVPQVLDDLVKETMADIKGLLYAAYEPVIIPNGLVQKIGEVARILAGAIRGKQLPNYTAVRMHEALRNAQFLERPEGIPAWEGRPDTLHPPIQAPGGRGVDLYLVEHRNN
jgi:hypothetical protein